ncbi:MAG: hypothetical protein COA96_15720 [SAR86 cluster bacterium]|uniref:Uncharacterized protein n=1 Tax=SAR86 cluster bacterium TaxID=2030880 RepID=A0A2A5APK0_9GAMM|nr:MAG: hypothetical protein COA96_15720 [SAR86 cluster bacterium]
MKDSYNVELHVNAIEMGLKDLDFPECAQKLISHIDENFSTSTQIVVLDLRKCVVIYSQTHEILDCCLNSFSSSKAIRKKLSILTTANYITRDLTCYQLFRTTLACRDEANDISSVEKVLDSYCRKNDLIISVDVYSGDSENDEATALDIFYFPENQEQ